MSLNVEYVYKVIDKFSGPLSKINRKLTINRERLKEISKTAKKTGKDFADLGKKMSVFVTLPILALGGAMIKAASDAEETRSKYATIFQDMSNKAESTADTLASSFGLSGTAARQLLGDTGDMLTGFGFSQEAALDLSKQVNELAVDLASFTNFSGGAEGASAALTKALLGERESVKSLGIAILEEDVKKKISIMRSKGMRFETKRQAKAYATLAIAVEQSKNAVGDYERTKASFANTMRRVQARLQDFNESFGRVLLPYALKVAQAIEKMLVGFTALSPATKKIIIIIAGLVAVIAPLLIGLGLVISAVGFIAAAFASAAAPIVAAIALLTSIFLLSVKFGEVLAELAFIFIPKIGEVIYNAFLAPFKLLSKIVGFIGKISGKAINFSVNSNSDAKATANNAADNKSAANNLNVNGGITVKAESGTSVTKNNINLNAGAQIGAY